MYDERYFVFGGKNVADFSAYVLAGGIDGAAARQVERMAVPGRNGEVIIDGGRYANQPHTYTIIITADYEKNLQALRNYLLSTVGYQRLEDTFYPDEYYLACYMSDFEPRTKVHRNAGTVMVEFSRKPQRLLRIGDAKRTLTSSGNIYNPTAFESKPLIRVYGKGTVGIGNNAITISATEGYTDIDCDIMESFYGATSKNSYVTIQNIDYPVLPPGKTGITLGSGISKVEITPRFYML